jgi:hypothetical protein
MQSNIKEKHSFESRAWINTNTSMPSTSGWVGDGRVWDTKEEAFNASKRYLETLAAGGHRVDIRITSFLTDFV